VKILIIGPTGGTGRILLEKALEQGHEVSALARNPSAVAPRDYRPRVLEGNTLDPDAVEAAVSGQDAVLSARGTRSTKPTTPFSASTANRLGPGASAMTRRRRRGGEARPRSPATSASNLFNGGKIDRRSTDGKQTP
jgi:uncharacterized protein YbjT (DUF2867 family)